MILYRSKKKKQPRHKGITDQVQEISAIETKQNAISKFADSVLFFVKHNIENNDGV